MKRREFLKAAGAAGLGVVAGPGSALARLASSREPTSAPEENPQPKPPAKKKYFIWTQPSPGSSTSELKTKYAALRKRGLTGIFLYGFHEREVGAIREAGLEAHIWIQTTNRGDKWIREGHPDWYMVSRSGKSCLDRPPYIASYKWVSPVIASFQRFLVELVDGLAAKEPVSGLHLDYVRYPDVILPRALWKKYGVVQNEELPDFDFCYSEHTRKAFREASGRDPLKIEDPAHDQEWLHFRYDSITKLVEKLAGAVRTRKKQISAAVFPTPRLARKICRQDWDKWPLAFAAPMLYHSYYEQPVEWVGDCVLEDVQAARFPIVAGLFMPAMKSPTELERGLKAAMKRGAAGISLFGTVNAEHWKVFERFLEAG